MAEQKVAQVTQSVSSGRGNTNNPTARCRQWCMTVNNWTEDDLAQVTQLAQRSKQYIVGKEVGSDGTPHLQCYFQFKSQMRFRTLKDAVPRAHIEKAKGSAQDNRRYCSKEGDFATNIPVRYTQEEIKELVRREYDNVQWRSWQQDVLDLIAEDSSSRTIYWIFEPAGNTGKSFLTKYLVLEESTVLCSGKAGDILHAISKAITVGILPTLVIFDVPRVSAEFISFQAIEAIKNGCAFSGKYEGCQIVMPSPTLLCFANIMPPIEKLSKDRWQIYEIKNNILYEKLI